ncbi:MAG: 50S ribosomal protein L21 [Elusimicrobia bacterium]|nr:50S ribosomal protein L21 [Elusimicrobiota bacterium]
MYAVIVAGGKQYWVSPGDTIRVERLNTEVGREVTLKGIWVATGDGISEGKNTEAVQKAALKAKVTAEVLRHLRAPKVIVFKKRRRKGYKRTQGHRQWLTELRIKEISAASVN